MNQLLTRKEVCAILRISYPTLCRWLNDGSFPQPVNGRKRKLLWKEQCIIDWTNRQAPPDEIVLPKVGLTQQKREEANFALRQKRAKQILSLHREGRREVK